MSTALAVLALTSTGLLVGVELSVAVVLNPILIALPIGPMIEGRSHGARMLGLAMPPWYIGSTLLIGGFALTSWGTSSATLGLIGVALLLVTVVLSAVVLVPINNRSATWTADEHPAEWRTLQRRWDRLHGVRVALIVAAFILLAVAVATR